ncbi:hypothetical protein Pcinc_029384 [Petrolisthes cinctipes]|uniref:Uncharacterized protein n=1 Tax=Petrolisthes cinctipes TaxID=88211 RepID=A0AAE1K5S0_PETCI|nr:hypothetical protein Pcinc_029384 [Petrolisthes cinctipes]
MKKGVAEAANVSVFLVVVAATAAFAKPSDPYHAPAHKPVEYIADHYNGYQAQVNYKGEAQYPHEYGPAVTFKPSGGYGPEPAYKPQPSYH